MEPDSQFTPPTEEQPMQPERPEQTEQPSSDVQFERPITPELIVEQPVQTAPKKKGKKIIGKILLILLILLLIAGGVGAYLWRDSQAAVQKSNDNTEISNLKNKITDLEKTAALAVSENATEETVALTTAQIANIKASITSKNTAALEGYMADSVTVVLAASESAASKTPTQAIASLSYLDSATEPWNFELDSVTLASYAAGDYATYFKDDSIVGKAANGYVIVFNFNDAAKINGIFMSSSADLLK